LMMFLPTRRFAYRQTQKKPEQTVVPASPLVDGIQKMTQTETPAVEIGLGRILVANLRSVAPRAGARCCLCRLSSASRMELPWVKRSSSRDLVLCQNTAHRHARGVLRLVRYHKTEMFCRRCVGLSVFFTLAPIDLPSGEKQTLPINTVYKAYSLGASSPPPRGKGFFGGGIYEFSGNRFLHVCSKRSVADGPHGFLKSPPNPTLVRAMSDRFIDSHPVKHLEHERRFTFIS